MHMKLLARLAPPSVSMLYMGVVCCAQQPEDEDRLKRWKEKHWSQGKTGWHKKDANAFLVEHFSKLTKEEKPRVLVPLCGKTVDLVWLAEHGADVVGAEGVELAVAQLAAENWLKFKRSEVQNLDNDSTGKPRFIPAEKFEGAKRGYIFTTREDGLGYYVDGPSKMAVFVETTKPLTIAIGDFFEMGPRTLGKFDAIWDRAALHALPPNLRPQYAKVCDGLMKKGGRILLVTTEYDQSKVEGPPFSVPLGEIKTLYGPLGYDIKLLAKEDYSSEYVSETWAHAKPVYENCVLMTKK